MYPSILWAKAYGPLTSPLKCTYSPFICSLLLPNKQSQSLVESNNHDSVAQEFGLGFSGWFFCWICWDHSRRLPTCWPPGAELIYDDHDAVVGIGCYLGL